ncbi:Ankyrin repeat-like protein [Candidatus Nitrospira nitrosa]|uniref:Ankyrin repeat-like protein n=1 Tax=Candidatus Nitrospira nitrosa TaxID=1742972 RepID=A0A0S4LPW8_9BACT|nr:caspase family protein [Candidatus Nitrospira nitrosa]CUS37979.1 Ankyrin repeat-like protein [Candidatus Nitrospira nitrosa]
MTHDHRLSNRGILAGAWIGAVLLVLAGCATHLEFPPMGTPLSASAKLETSSALKDLTLRYTDTCGQLQEFPLGERLQEALQEGLHRTFDRVVSEGAESAGPPDHVVQVDLVDSSFDLNKEALYDRAPALIHLNAIARIYDRTGTLLRQTDIAVSRQERLRLEQISKNCDYIIGPFIQDTTIDFATRVALTAKQAAASHDALSSTEPTAPPSESLIVPPTLSPIRPEQPNGSAASSALRFKALLLDENSDLMFEGGEHIRVRVDVVNTGSTLVENASVSLTGTRLTLEQFPTTVLRIPPLQPGQTRSLEFVATLPLLAQPEQAEIRVIVEERSGAAAPPQTLSFTIAPTGTRGDDVDQVSTQASTVQHPAISVVAIGISSTLTQQIPSRTHAAHDAETVAKYFQTLGGVPSSNIALLTDRKATSAQIEKTLREWLPTRSTTDGIVIIYYSGQAMVSPRGEIMLVPYDGTKTPTSLYRLSALESVLARLHPQQAILIFDGKTSPIVDQTKTPPTPRWDLDGENTIRLIAVEGLATGIEDDAHRHGLFTYYLLRGLRGEADTNRDGKVTLGEMSGFVRQKVAWASKSQFGTTQRPQIIPLLKADDKATDLVLTTLPSLSASEAP